MLKRDHSLLIRFLMPALVLTCIVFVYPIIRTIIMSFFHVENITGSVSAWQFAGIDNYIKLSKTDLFLSALKNLGKIWLYGGIIVFTISMLFAVILNSGIKGKKAFRSMIYMPYTISVIAMATMWLQYIYNPRYGLLTKFFSAIGWESMASFSWTSPEHKFMAMLIAYCFSMVGYNMVILSSGIESIPQDYYDAAVIDGCNVFSKFFHITMPLLKGVIKTCLTMWSIQASIFFVWSQMFTGAGGEASVITPVVYLYTMVFGAVDGEIQRDAGLASAVGVLVCIIILLFFTAINTALKDSDYEM